MFEYLGAGTAVVGMRLENLSDLGGMVRLSETPEAFVEDVRMALEDNAEEAVARRISLARRNTWDDRARTVLAGIRDALG